MTTKQYRKTERLAVECENFDSRLHHGDYTDRYEWQEILDSYRNARDLCVNTYEFKRFRRYLSLILADVYRRDKLYDKLLTEWETEEREISEEEIAIAEALDKEIEINE